MGAILLLAIVPGVVAQAPGTAPTGEGPPPAVLSETLAPAAAEPQPAGTAIEPAPAPAKDKVHDLSPWGMFMAADIVVKAVTVFLVLASVLTWTVWLAKSLELMAARGRARRACEALEQAETLANGAAAWKAQRIKGGAPVALLASATQELRRSPGHSHEGVKERIAIALNRVEARAGRRMAAGTGVLASIGATAPFIGLFGTVWGIMNSFIGIAQSKTTNLAVVAPGIAEALFVTGVGLVAAIPAVIFYNVIARSTAGFRAELSDISAAILRHVSRDMECDQDRARRLPGMPAPAAPEPVRPARARVAAE
jgi:biopolymer transport protein ExbB